MENINIKVILDEVFGKSCDSITCDTCKYKEDCELINKFINDIKDKGLSPDQYVRGLALFVYVLKEQKYLNDFGKTQEDIIKLATENGFELDWLINRWDSIIKDKDILKLILLFIIINRLINHFNHFLIFCIRSINNMLSNQIINFSISINNINNHIFSIFRKNSNDRFKNVSDDEIYAELKRRKANKSAK